MKFKTNKYGRIECVTPRAILQPYAYLVKPDTKFDPDGKYKADFALEKDSPECIALMERINEIAHSQYDDALAEYERNPPKPVRGKVPPAPVLNDLPYWEEGDYVIFRASSKATLKQKDGTSRANVLRLADSKGGVLTNIPAPAKGSICKFKLEISSYATGGKYGCTLYLQAVMIIDLVKYQGGSGFDAEDFEEDGYVAEQEDFSDDNNDNQPSDSNGDF